MKRKVNIKPPGFSREPGGGAAKRRARVISYNQYSTNPPKSKTIDLSLYADTLDMKSEIYSLLSQAARLTAILRERGHYE